MVANICIRFGKGCLLPVVLFLAACSGIDTSSTDCSDPNFFVNTAEDVNDGACTEGHCALREAVIAANTCTAHPEYSIWIPPGTYELSLRGPDERGDLNVNRSMRIFGAAVRSTLIAPDGTETISYGSVEDPTLTTITGDSAWPTRILSVDLNVLLDMENLTITGGDSDESSGGGGVLNRGAIRLFRVHMIENRSRLKGGGLSNIGMAELFDSEIRDNEAGREFQRNAEVDECGGGIYNQGRLFLRSSRILNNEGNNGRGLCNKFTGEVEINDSRIEGNGADFPWESYGGGIFDTGRRMLIHDSVVANNGAGYGGGIYASSETFLNLQGSIVVGNNANESTGRSGIDFGGFGGGIFIGGSSLLRIADSVLVENTATREGGALRINLSGEDLNSIERTAIVGNQVTSGAGGGIYIRDGNLSLANSTLSSNDGSIGAALYNTHGADTSLLHVTVADNTSTSSAGSGPGGTLVHDASRPLNFRNSLIIRNVTTCNGDLLGFQSVGGNFTDVALCGLRGPDDLIPSGPPPVASNVSPLLSVDSTFVHELFPANPAIDYIPPAPSGFCSGRDQRGVARPVGAGCDIGAVESDASTMSLETPIELATITPTPGGQVPVVITTGARCRSGPSVSFSEIAFFNAGSSTFARGRSSDSNWYYLAAPAGLGSCWTAASVLEFEVSEDILLALPVIQAPPTPTPTATQEPVGMPPAEPGNAFISNQLCTDTEYSVEITWFDAADNEDGYNIYRDGMLIATVGANSSSFADQPPYGGPYTYTIEAFNGFGTSSTTVNEAGCIF